MPETENSSAALDVTAIRARNEKANTEMRAICDVVASLHDVPALCDALDARDAEIARLTIALSRFGDRFDDCEARDSVFRPCGCGYDSALVHEARA